MTVYSGKDGSLVWQGSTTTRVRNWTLSSTLDALEVTDLGDDARAYIPGLKSATGTATIFYHDDNSSLRAILDNCITTGSGSAGSLSLRWGTRKIDMSVIVTAANITCTTGEVMTADITFQMTGNYQSIGL